MNLDVADILASFPCLDESLVPKPDLHAKHAYTTPKVELALPNTKLCSATRKRDQRQVCVKKLRVRQDKVSQWFVDNEAVMSLLCSGATNTLVYHEAFRAKHNVWLVMDFVEGTTLRGLVDEVGGLAHEPFAAFAAKHMLLAIRDMHAKHRAHRDVKPDNFLVCEDGGALRMIDFGWAIQLSKERPTTNQRVGTLHYMAPDVLDERDYALEADVWSLGVTVVELITGQVPHGELDVPDAVAAIMQGPAPRLPSKFNGTPAAAFVAECLQKDARHRPTCEALLAHDFIQRACSEQEWAGLVARAFGEPSRVKS